MIGDIIMLTGVIATWAIVDNPDTGTEEARPDTDDTADPTTPETVDTGAAIAAPASEASDATPASGADRRPLRPARLNGGRLNDGNAAATPVAPTW
jgi:hypothetical protein